jgi:predicted kinase
MLIVLSGVPGVGKSSIARELARQLPAVHLRIDTIEALLAAPIDDLGYRIAYALAEENLRLGLSVIADSVNPLAITRDAWLDVARRALVPVVEVEIRCSDAAEHRRRVDSRPSPTWQEVVDREYHPWTRDRVVVDTAGRAPADCVREIRATLRLS